MGQFQLKFSSLFLLLLTFGFTLAACGKVSPPQAPNTKRDFDFTFAKAEIQSDGCMNIEAGLEGNMDKLFGVTLEYAGKASEDLCLTCPFSPETREDFSKSSTVKIAEGSDPEHQTATVNIFYCPNNPTFAYEWRLVAVNVYQNIPNALTPVQYLIRPPTDKNISK